MPKRLEIVGDSDPLFPVQAFFNAVSDDSFVRTVSNLVVGIGAGADDAFCEFPGDLDPGDDPFEGVRFALYEDEVAVDERTFRRFLRLACDAYISAHPEDVEKIEDLLATEAEGDKQNENESKVTDEV